jgi:hypothetical protein
VLAGPPLEALDKGGLPRQGPDYLHGHRILGKVTLPPGPEREKALEALDQGVVTHGPTAGCFFPRHALLTVRHGRTVAVLLCFQCGAVWVDDGDGEATAQTLHTDKAPEPALDAPSGRPGCCWRRKMAPTAGSPGKGTGELEVGKPRTHPSLAPSAAPIR